MSDPGFDQWRWNIYENCNRIRLTRNPEDFIIELADEVTTSGSGKAQRAGLNGRVYLTREEAEWLQEQLAELLADPNWRDQTKEAQAWRSPPVD